MYQVLGIFGLHSDYISRDQIQIYGEEIDPATLIRTEVARVDQGKWITGERYRIDRYGSLRIIDNQRRSVIVHNSSECLRACDGSIGRTSQRDKERLIRFTQRIAQNTYRERPGHLARRE